MCELCNAFIMICIKKKAERNTQAEIVQVSKTARKKREEDGREEHRVQLPGVQQPR